MAKSVYLIVNILIKPSPQALLHNLKLIHLQPPPNSPPPNHPNPKPILPLPQLNLPSNPAKN